MAGKLVRLVNRDSEALKKETIAAGFEFVGFSVEPDRASLEQLVQLVEAGELSVHVGQEFPFDQVVAAHAALDEGSGLGKIVLIP